jgi:5-methyltetrahydrofolate--homocysteine methyltransferase
MDVADKAKAVSDQVISPLLAQAGEGSMSRGTFVIASVRGDLHDIGKNMVALMLEVNGFRVIDMGIDVAPRDAIDRALEVNADFLGLSSLMTTSMPYMKECVELRDGLGHKGKFWVLVGGAPITPEYAQMIGADGFGSDAIEAVNTSLALLESRD